MGFQNHQGTYVKILTGVYAGKYGEAGLSNSDTDTVQVFPIGLKGRVVFLDIFQDIEVIKCPAQIETIKILYEKVNNAK